MIGPSFITSGRSIDGMEMGSSDGGSDMMESPGSLSSERSRMSPGSTKCYMMSHKLIHTHDDIMVC